MYTVTFFKNTGLNAVNTCDNLAALTSFSDTPIVSSNCDIISCRNLSSFRVALTPAQLENADYCHVSGDNDSAVFSIQGVIPTSPDVCEVYVTIDYWLTAGGISNTDVLDGITERHHVPKSSDSIGAYVEDDPWIAPSKPLEIVDAGTIFDYTLDGNALGLIESTLDLKAMGDPTNPLLADIYKDTDTNETVSVPKTIPLYNQFTWVRLYNPPAGGVKSAKTPVTVYYDASNQQIQNGYSRCRELGVEGCILNSWLIPIDAYTSNETTINGGKVSDLIGKMKVQTLTSLPYEYASAFNKRVYTGKYNKYVLQAIASGNMAEFNPEDIMHGTDSYPTLCATSDPRPDGKPYFRFEYYKNSNYFWSNCVPGLEWENAPLVYYQKEGKIIDRTIFNSERANYAELNGTGIANKGFGLATDAGQATFDIASAGMGVERAAMGNGRSASIAGYRGAQQGLASSIYNGVAGLFTGFANMGVGQRQYHIERENELRRFNISMNVVEPLIQYPRENSLRDFLGNGCRAYRLRYSAFDVSKVDKILTAYGYKDTAILEPSFFTNRAKFNYIMAHGVSFNKNNIPKWIRDGMAAQLEAGMRIWHVKPYAAAYTDNSNT